LGKTRLLRQQEKEKRQEKTWTKAKASEERKGGENVLDEKEGKKDLGKTKKKKKPFVGGKKKIIRSGISLSGGSNE